MKLIGTNFDDTGTFAGSSFSAFQGNVSSVWPTRTREEIWISHRAVKVKVSSISIFKAETIKIQF